MKRADDAIASSAEHHRGTHPARHAERHRLEGSAIALPEPETGGMRGPDELPLFLRVRHRDPFWCRQAEMLAETWRAEPIGPSVGITWRRGQVTGDATWKDILAAFDRPIECDPEFPDEQLLRALGEGLSALRRTCSDYRLNCFTTGRVIHGFLTSVLFESEVQV